MIIEEFSADLLQEVERQAAAKGQFRQEAFLEYAVEILSENGQISDFQHALLEQRGIQVHGFDPDYTQNGGLLAILLVDYADTEKGRTLTQTDLRKVFNRAHNFVREAKEGYLLETLNETSPAFELADMIFTKWDYFNKIEITLVSNKTLSRRVDSQNVDDILGKPVAHSIWDLTRFHQVELSSGGREEIEIELFDDEGNGLKAIETSGPNSEYQSYLLSIPGLTLANIYDKWRDRLLEQNVRVFLQSRSKVNRGIMATLEQAPEMFFAYNNGLSATATEVYLDRTIDALSVTGIRNLQIVNGAQTTASIHSALINRKLDLTDVRVQMKLTIVPPEKVMELVPKISQYANSQNSVNAADFFANHPFHIFFEEASRRIFAPSADGISRQSKWFYERARGQYQDRRANLSRSKVKEFDLEYPKSQKFSKTDLAKFDTVWRQLPHEVSAGAQKNFAEFAKHIDKKWNENQASFGDMYFRDSVAKAIVFKETERLVSTAEWYAKGYRANIVAYGVAKLAQLIDRRGLAPDFQQIWQSQSLNTDLRQALDLCCEAAQAIILNPTGAGNLSEWAKKSACWSAFKEVSIPGLPSLASFTIAKEKAGFRTSDSQKEAVIDHGIRAQVKVLEIAPEQWKMIRDWGNERGIASATDLGILRIATSIPNKIPTEGQSKRLLDIVGRLDEHGCPFVKGI